ncbi:MAG: endonuclease/exonuclease/phosphatase family protein [Treponema sp.]|nr:endonuclease/exonuclease/phosphatase family protein [Treponema sp.]
MKNLRLTILRQRLVWLFAAAVFFSGCDVSEPEIQEEITSLTMMTWNINNLFDGNDDGYEYAEYQQASGWSAEKYLGRINAITDAIKKIDELPDIIMFQEVESRAIIDDIAAALSQDFLWSHFAGNPASAIGLGIISRFPLIDAKTHSITIGNETTPRPVLETKVQTTKGDFIIFTCHWKSKIGGDDVTENIRRSSARAILRRVREIWKSEPDTGIIITGDLNENFNEFYKQSSKYICALLPDDPYCVTLSNIEEEKQMDYIVITGAVPPLPVYFPDETIIFFSPWVNELSDGSYFYKNNWETIDHFLVSHQFFNRTGWEYSHTFTAGFEPFTNVHGYPAAYNPRTGNGLSDHLPLIMTLRWK